MVNSPMVIVVVVPLKMGVVGPLPNGHENGL